MNKWIYLIERNAHGAYVIYGELGVRQYYGYTREESKRKYMDECRKRIVVNQK